jgi:hypothetical protein
METPCASRELPLRGEIDVVLRGNGGQPDGLYAEADRCLDRLPAQASDRVVQRDRPGTFTFFRQDVLVQEGGAGGVMVVVLRGRSAL